MSHNKSVLFCASSQFILYVLCTTAIIPELYSFPVTVSTSSNIAKKNAKLLQKFQAHNDNASMLLVTAHKKFILIQDNYEAQTVSNQPYYNAEDQIIGGYAYGLWLFYSEPNYNWDEDTNKMIPNSHVEWIFSTDRNKFYTFRSNISSFRTPGGNSGSNDVTESSFTVFLGHNYTGPSDFEADTNYANIPYSKPKSLIITGNNLWYVYTASNFVQRAVCIVPTNYHLLIPDFYAHQQTKLIRHYNSTHKDGCAVQYVNETTSEGFKAKIIDVEVVSEQNIRIRRVPPIFMRDENDDDSNKVNY